MIKLNTSLFAIIVLAALLCLPITSSHAQNENPPLDTTQCAECHNVCRRVPINDQKRCEEMCQPFCSEPQSVLTKSTTTVPQDNPCQACTWKCRNMVSGEDARACLNECFHDVCRE
ncbi:hypothetical protein SAMN06295888_11016 [Desulfonatronum zhilinae]|nr:hypothetical protein SAMN06295888_11016 [Desulfonatronum zhilinae]